MSKSKFPAADAVSETSPTEPPPPAEPGFDLQAITVVDSDEGLEALRNFGLTVTRDTNPGVIITLDLPIRVFGGAVVTKLKPGKYSITPHDAPEVANA